ncbi:hypothetical protein NKR23_g5344 [Pleurostoma richardsiae]|uniref:Uncharacterized protein n=1 Tax=Pleurostoma richardsiae TaxID=41990 RepID=A0AA38RPG3_9PEZI|nr:hypothetical protein NKR23_g5344 [Pleurostoma richardsiae]
MPRLLVRASRAPAASTRVSSSSASSSPTSDRKPTKNSPTESPDMQDKEQVQAEKAAKSPRKMANLKDQDRPQSEDVVGNSGTPGVKTESGKDDRIGRAVKDKASG